MEPHDLESLPFQLLGAFFKFTHTPWHMVPAPGLSRAETGVLLSIERATRTGERIRVSDLSNRMRVSSPTITRQLDSLEAQGFVTRTQSKNDKRAVDLALTEKGSEALRRHREMMESNMRELAELLGNDNSELLVKLLNTTSDFFVEKQKGYGIELDDRR